MLTAIITRTYQKNVTISTMVCSKPNADDLVLKTIELPWRNNQPRVSCIPEGVYLVHFMDSPRLKRKTYRVSNVKGRDGILFHPANFASQLLGCIAPCKDFADLNKDGVIDGTSSREATSLLEKYFGGQSFHLSIISAAQS